MTSDSNGLTDEVSAQINPSDETIATMKAFLADFTKVAREYVADNPEGGPEVDRVMAALQQVEGIPGVGEPAPAVLERPADGSPKAKWVEYAQSHGLDLRDGRDEAWTRAELIGWCGGSRPERLTEVDRVIEEQAENASAYAAAEAEAAAQAEKESGE